MTGVSPEVRNEAANRRKLFAAVVREAKVTVESAIDSLDAQPRTFGGHLEKLGTCSFEALPRDRVQHHDGRVMRFVRFLDPPSTPYLTALVTYRGRWLVVPSHKLREIG